MPRVEWDANGSRIFEAGIDRGMLYVGSSPGVVWNGLVKVSETPTVIATGEYYVDGQKVLNVGGISEYSATLEAVAPPRSFAPCAGLLQLSPGLLVPGQPKKPFGFSYRTLIGSDSQEPGTNYKIHVVYNVTAKGSNYTRQSTALRSGLKTFSWALTAIPEVLPNFAPTAHFVVDTRKIDQYTLAAVEALLYGTEFADPRLPTSAELLFLLDTGVSVLTDTAISMKKMAIDVEVNSYESGVSGDARLDKMKTAGAGVGTAKVTSGPRLDKMKAAGAGAGATAATGAIKTKKMTISSAVAGITTVSTAVPKMKKLTIASSAGLWTLVPRGNIAVGGTTGVTSYQLPLTGWTGTNPSAGDLLFAIVRTSTTGNETWGQSAGSTWTKIFDNEGSGKAGGYSYSIWYRAFQVGDTAPTFTWSNSTSNVLVHGTSFRPFSGSTSPIYTAEVSTKVDAGDSTTGVNSIDPSSATAAAAGRTSLIFLAGRSSTGNNVGTVTLTPPAGWSVASTAEICPSGNNPRIAGCCYRGGCPSGVIDPGSLSWVDSVSNAFAMSAVQVLIRPGP